MPDAAFGHVRPEIQRTDIGPVFHDIAHRTYDYLEGELIRGHLETPAPETLSDLRPAFVPLIKRAQEVANNYRVDTAFIEHVRDLVDTKNYGQRYDDGLRVQKYTATTIHGNELMDEAIGSGLLVPIRLIETITAAEHESDIDSMDLSHDRLQFANFAKNVFQLINSEIELPIDPKEIVLRLGEANFVEMLLELAYAPNGYLGGSSTNIYSPGVLSCFTDAEVATEIFDFDDQGKVTGFSRSFLFEKKQEIADATKNRESRPGRYSGGCPVRHESFTKIGDYAAGYLKEVNEDGRPRNEGESAITRGARLVAFALNHAVATTWQRF